MLLRDLACSHCTASYRVLKLSGCSEVARDDSTAHEVQRELAHVCGLSVEVNGQGSLEWLANYNISLLSVSFLKKTGDSPFYLLTLFN